MQMMKCYICGNKIETIPLNCAHSIILNEKSNRWECFMGPDCGFINIDEILCSKCAKKGCNTG
jgi:hypothetical protein